MANTSHLSSHEIIGGHSFSTTELNEGSSIFESNEQGARELTNREAAGLLLGALQGASEASISENQTNAHVVPMPHKPKWHGRRVSQFLSNMSPGYGESVKGQKIYGEYMSSVASDGTHEEKVS